jgi:Ser-tRNA(Ala) deacylase AlaX
MNKKIDPAMHSAEHILNQTMIRMFDCGRCVSAHIEKKKSKCDYPFDRDLNPKEVRDIEKRVNEIVQADLPLTEQWLAKDEAARRFRLDRVPEDAGQTIRIVNVGDYDACPCIGPHVGSTRKIGQFRITTTSYDDGILRIRFKLGRR